MAKSKKNPEAEMTFLEHLEALRWHLMRSAIVILSFAIVAFINKDWVFDKLLLAPKQSNFITYRVLCRLGEKLGMGDALCIGEQSFGLINTELSGQFTMHMWASFVAGLIAGAPYLFWEIWLFVKPALKSSEKKYTRGVVFFTTLLFASGVLFGYYVIAPLSINFLGTYQVSSEVQNLIQMDSFISTVTTITLAAGIVFELPVVVYFLAKTGIMSSAFMKKFRKHAVVVILILAAVITPSPDITSQLLVALPLYVLYELSIFVARAVEKKDPYYDGTYQS